MKHRRSIILVALLVVFITASGFQDSTPYKVLFEKARFTMETKGDLSGAIELFSEIIRKYPEQREYAAKSQLYIGLCYEKLGLEEAQKAYRKVLENYPEQEQEVAMAKENLNRLLASMNVPHKPTFRRIRIPTRLSWCVKLSPDGKTLALVFDDKIWLMPLTGNLGPELPGTPVPLNTGGIEVEWSGLDWSRDGKWIAFNEITRRDEQGNRIEEQRIFIVPSTGGTPRVVTENYRDWRVVNYRISLDDHGKNLAFSSVEDRQQHIYTIPTEGGSPVQLCDKNAREPVYSPDGTLIAFVEDKDMGAIAGDLGLWVMPAGGGIPHRVAEGGMASSPVWSPDGSMIAFVDYSHGQQIYIVPVSREGLAAGEVTTIDVPEGIEEVRILAGWTPDQKIGALMFTEQEFGLYTLPATGGQAAKILHDQVAYQPRWSPNGSQIYYVTSPDEGENRSYGKLLASVPATGGQGKPVAIKNPEGDTIRQFSYQSGNRISPDGKWIVSAAWTSADTGVVKVSWPANNIWKIATDGTESIQITHHGGPFTDSSPCWSPDGRKIAFVRCELIEERMNPMGESGIYMIDAAGGDPELLISKAGHYFYSLVWSPDGNTIAYFTFDREEPHTKNLNLLDVETRLTRVAGEVPYLQVNIEMAWSPDSKHIAFNDVEEKIITVMNTEDGSTEKIETGLVDVDIYHLDWSPDGEKFVFGGIKGGNREFWFLEDFLPE